MLTAMNVMLTLQRNNIIKNRLKKKFMKNIDLIN
ncbi:hypothetical protein VINI7043_05816 [Vibrio nigripulchritudo ATCC 27043]|nr:hypothetical protein VINI7043_05816 [Vibrio nigripulchritudo ATCC 27043]